MKIDSILRSPVLRFPPILFVILYTRNIFQIISRIIQNFLGKDKDSNIAFISCLLFFSMNVTTHTEMPLLGHIFLAIASVAIILCSFQNSWRIILLRFFAIMIPYFLMINSFFMECNFNFIDNIYFFITVYTIFVPLYSLCTFRIIRKRFPTYFQRSFLRKKSVAEDSKHGHKNFSFLVEKRDMTEQVIEMQKKYLHILKKELTRRNIIKNIDLLSELGGLERTSIPNASHSETEDIHTKIKETLAKQEQIKNDLKRENEKLSMREVYMEYKACTLTTESKTSC